MIASDLTGRTRCRISRLWGGHVSAESPLSGSFGDGYRGAIGLLLRLLEFGEGVDEGPGQGYLELVIGLDREDPADFVCDVFHARTTGVGRDCSLRLSGKFRIAVFETMGCR